MDVDETPYSLGSSPSGAVERRPVFGFFDPTEGSLRTSGDVDDTADQDDLDTWWAQTAGQGRWK